MKNKFHKEVEVKAKIGEFGHVKKKLQQLGCRFSKPIAQKDTNFINAENTFPKITPGCVVLRIREQNGKKFLTYKKAVSNELDRIERELEISDRKSMEDIIEFLGFYKIITVQKKRIKTSYKNTEICFDEVKDLGSFIEVERMTNDSNGEKIQEDLLKFLEGLGISRNDCIFQGYDTLLYEKELKINLL